MRKALEGMYLPRDDLIGWRVETGQGSYTNEAPGPIAQVDVELDAVGCLTSGSVALKRPRHPVFPAYRFTAKLWLQSKTQGWVDVALGFIPPAREDGREEWSLELRPMEELAMGGYADGALLGGHNTLGTEIGGWKETNEAVISRILQRSPAAMLGTHADGSTVLARPEDGSPVNVSQARFFEWKSTGLVTLPYATESRWDGGPGWRKGAFTGIARPPLTPRKAVDAGEVEFKEVIQASGPPLIGEQELIVGEVKAAAPSGDPPPAGNPAPSIAGQLGLIKRTVTAEQYAYVRVYDLGAWFEGSALAGQDNDLIKTLKDQLKTAQGAYALAHDTLGQKDHFTGIEQGRMLDAESAIRVARWKQGGVESDYEPLTAKLSIGFVLEEFKKYDVYRINLIDIEKDDDPSILTGTSMWISRSGGDEDAVGEQTDPDTGTGDDGLVHPLLSTSTIKIFDTHVVELDKESRNTPFQQGALTIPPDYFRGPLGPALASLMDKQWKESFDPEDPPEDEQPPSRSWDGVMLQGILPKTSAHL